ncbi:hypothetical protein PHMEG_00039863 [Phytophthora megakarya]|uniref:PiggyBac transposable element-derived protein domain-containing protein n=1 Tax=Phytophthora megakarya TaxID=4795 RepID=A0A225UEK4_9STRA|nr:hypothetical protein PHMEG_00039863 [Phytophthora megakarya]
MKFLHFNSNMDTELRRDKAWKVRPLLQTIEKTFRRGYRLGKVISFDEGMMPNRSKFNPMRMFMPDKPSKYGTKFYMTCCAETAYCSRVEVYCGATKPKKKKKDRTPDDLLGEASTAVIRNVSKALLGQKPKRLVVTDSFYTSVALSLKLMQMKLYHVGTARVDRLGWCQMQFTQKKRPKRMQRGTYRIAQSRDHPKLVALSWMDSKPVNMLATGCSTHLTSVERTEKDGTRSTVPCPQMVVDYGKGMGGVDVHDQLRLHRYIRKSNGVDIRLCIDYKLVNSLTRLMVYPMPLISDLLEGLDKALWYCSLDMASGFWT